MNYQEFLEYKREYNITSDTAKELSKKIEEKYHDEAIEDAAMEEMVDIEGADKKNRADIKVIEDRLSNAIKRDKIAIKVISVIIGIILLGAFICGVKLNGKTITTAADMSTIVGFVAMILTKFIVDLDHRHIENLTTEFNREMREIDTSATVDINDTDES